MPMPDLFDRARTELAAGAHGIGRATELAYKNADRFVLGELDDQPTITIDHVPGWIDTRPLLDQREHSPQVIDIWAETLDYADWRGLVRRHPSQPHMVRLVRMGA